MLEQVVVLSYLLLLTTVLEAVLVLEQAVELSNAQLEVRLH